MSEFEAGGDVHPVNVIDEAASLKRVPYGPRPLLPYPRPPDVTAELEAVAVAIYRACEGDLLAWDQRNGHAKKLYYRMARAALMAIRVPSQSIIDSVEIELNRTAGSV